ncbi:arsenate reductase [Roseivivax halodurans JCM 10272]|uniref:Arsenate reductase n=1 Tax=Roseivivax halodurans JCM 10272 TaxID=1449350 RepID=X7EJN4_9RHOB|nr:ArsC/Spx/MgsR family protein [Roseivivax halodurans]ETX16132.1 arsenate reductase [Roseivivax halodurans JCM 10272]
MIIYGIKACDTCRTARKALPDAQFVDVREDGLPQEVRDLALETYGPQLLNTRSTTWRGLSEEERERPPAELLADHPALMKRPLIDDGGALYLGWSDGVRKELGL